MLLECTLSVPAIYVASFRIFSYLIASDFLGTFSFCQIMTLASLDAENQA